MNWAAIIWLAVMLISVSIELGTVSLTSLWFACGALVAMIASLLHAPLALQVVLFLSVSVALLFLLRPVVKKYLNPRLVRTNVDAVIGTEGIVTAQVDNLKATGSVKLGALEWSARSTSGEVIEPGTRVKVDRIEGVKAYVTPAEVNVTV